MTPNDAGTMGRDEAVEVLERIRDVIAAADIGCLDDASDSYGRAWPVRDEVVHDLTKAIAALQAQAPAEAWRDVAIANAAIVDEIRDVVGLTGKPGDVVKAVRKLVALQVQGEAQQPAAAPCCMCGNPVDTRENGTPGAELTDGRWTCSHECFDKATAQHQEPTT